MNLSQCIVECEERLSSQTLPDISSTTSLTIGRSLTLLGMTVVIASTMRIIIRETQVLAELQKWEQLDFNEGTAEIVDAMQLILGAVYISCRIRSQPVEIIHLGCIRVRTVGWREQQRRTYNTGIVTQCVGKISSTVGEALVSTDFQPTVDMACDVGTKCITLVA